MNMSAFHPGFRVYSGARADIARITAIWRDCLGASGGPLLFGERPTTADAMFAPICNNITGAASLSAMIPQTTTTPSTV